MNNVEYLISLVKRDIPINILNMGFLANSEFNLVKPSLEFMIHNKIIQNWVLIDCNMVAGIEAIIDITSCPRENVVMGTIVRVGFGPTAGRVITSVLSVGYGYNALSGGQATIASAITEPLQTSDSRITLVGTNVVYVEGYTGIYLTNIRCVLENDIGFNNIMPRAMQKLGAMCLLATKAYLYNELTLRLSNGVIVNGVDMSRLMDIVNGYSDAYQMYTDMLNDEWPKISMFSDRPAINRYIKMIMPS